MRFAFCLLALATAFASEAAAGEATTLGNLAKSLDGMRLVLQDENGMRRARAHERGGSASLALVVLTPYIQLRAGGFR